MLQGVHLHATLSDIGKHIPGDDIHDVYTWKFSKFLKLMLVEFQYATSHLEIRFETISPSSTMCGVLLYVIGLGLGIIAT